MRVERGAYVSRVVREHLFAPGNPDRRLVGVSVELIPLLADSGRVCPIDREGGVSSAALLRRVGQTCGWREYRDAAGAPRFFTPDASTVKFRPGGQIALAVSPCATIDEALELVGHTLGVLREAGRRFGVELFSCGVDPVNNILDVPLQLETETNVRLARYLESLGPSGARLTRQGAGLTIHLDAGSTPGARWRFLSDLSPYLTAIFANSRRYAGLDSGLQSYRAYCRRTLDTSRVGALATDGDPRDAYLDFALDAVDPMRRDPDGRYRSYREWIALGEWSPESWERHLATLFPEVRPRGHLELRAIDAMPLRLLAAPLVLVCGLTYHEPTALEAAALVASADDAMLWRAAGVGLHDPNVSAISRELVGLGLRGAKALGSAYMPAGHLAAAREFFERYTLHDLALADDAPAPHPTPTAVPRLIVVDRGLGFGRFA